MASDAETTDLSFEDALRELETIVQKLERGDVPLDQSIELYSRGDRLRGICEARLKAAQARIERIQQGSGGAAESTAPFDAG